MSYHQQDGSAYGYSGESSDESFNYWPASPPTVHSRSIVPSANANVRANFNSAQDPPQAVILAPTFPATPSLHSTRQQNVVIQATVNPRQLYQPASTPLGTVRLESYQNDAAQISWRENFSYARDSTAKDASRPGRAGKILCDYCRRRRKGFRCDRDDNDFTSRCSPCKEKNLPCSERTLPPSRMENLRANIQDDRFKNILKWMTRLDDKDREWIITRLPPVEAKRLFAACNMDFSTHSSYTEKTKISREKPVDVHGLVVAATPNPQAISTVAAYEQPPSEKLPINPLQDFIAQPLMPVQFYSHELTPPSTSPFSAPESSYSYQPTSPTIEDPFREFATVAQTPIAETQPWPPWDETYSSTWTRNDIAAFFTKTLSRRFHLVEKARVESLFTQVYETLENENKDNATQSSESGGQKIFGVSGSGYSYTSGESSVHGYN